MKSIIRIVSAMVAPVIYLDAGHAGATAEIAGGFPPGPFVPPADSSPAMVLAFDVIQPRTIEAVSGIVRYEATEAQRKAAIERASTYCAHLSPEKKLAITKKKVTYLAVPVPRSDKTSRNAKAVVMIVKVQEETKEDTNAKPPPEAKAPSPAKAPAKVKDHRDVETLSKSLINNDAYELPIVPTAGTSTKFDTITAQYIGE
jgi:hypothetical protein